MHVSRPVHASWRVRVRAPWRMRVPAPWRLRVGDFVRLNPDCERVHCNMKRETMVEL